MGRPLLAAFSQFNADQQCAGDLLPSPPAQSARDTRQVSTSSITSADLLSTLFIRSTAKSDQNTAAYRTQQAMSIETQSIGLEDTQSDNMSVHELGTDGIPKEIRDAIKVAADVRCTLITAVAITLLDRKIGSKDNCLQTR